MLSACLNYGNQMMDCPPKYNARLDKSFQYDPVFPRKDCEFIIVIHAYVLGLFPSFANVSL